MRVRERMREREGDQEFKFQSIKENRKLDFSLYFILNCDHRPACDSLHKQFDSCKVEP